MKFSCGDEYEEEACYTILSTLVMFETFHNKRGGEKIKREREERQSQKLDTKAAALVNRSDQLGMPTTCPQRPLPPAGIWVRKRGQSVTLRATLNVASQAPLNPNPWTLS